ncbi:MAG: hypothetical protein ACP5UN_01465 [Candidatus Micrarchaeia archaeon]
MNKKNLYIALVAVVFVIMIVLIYTFYISPNNTKYAVKSSYIPFPSVLHGMREVIARTNSNIIALSEMSPGIKGIINSSTITYVSNSSNTLSTLILMQDVFSNQTTAQNTYQYLIKNASNTLPPNVIKISNLTSNYFGIYFEENSIIGSTTYYIIVGQNNTRMCVSALNTKSNIFNSSFISDLEDDVNGCLNKYYLPANQSNYTNSTLLSIISNYTANSNQTPSANSINTLNQPKNYSSTFPLNIGTFKRVSAVAFPSIENLTDNKIINQTVNSYENLTSSVTLTKEIYKNETLSASNFNSMMQVFKNFSTKANINIINNLPNNYFGTYFSSNNLYIDYNIDALNSTEICLVSLIDKNNSVYNQNIINTITNTFVPTCFKSS